MSVMEQAEIQSILPHRYPFLLVDRVQELEPDRRIVGFKNVTINEPFFQGHFPGRPVMPGVLILEAMSQVGAILAFKSLGNVARPVVYLTGIDGAKFRKPVVPGDRLRFEIDVVKKRAPFWKMQGKAFVEDELVCEAEVTAMVTEEKDAKRESLYVKREEMGPVTLRDSRITIDDLRSPEVQSADSFNSDCSSQGESRR